MFLLTVVQFYLAAVGAFDEPRDDASFEMHRMNGMMVFPIVTVLTTIVAALARAPGRLIALTLLPVPMAATQMLIRAIAEAFDTSSGDTTAVGLAIFGLHAINGLLIMVLTRVLFVRARKLLASSRVTEPAAEPARSPVG